MSMEGIRRICNPIVDFSKFISTKKLLSKIEPKSQPIL